MNRNPKQRDAYIAIAFALIFVIILCAASFVIVRPFLAPLLWGVILAIATWPAFVWCRRHLGGRDTLAAALMTLLLALVLLGRGDDGKRRGAGGSAAGRDPKWPRAA
jgi:predicted PurR-regulated permease PerM